MQPQPSPARQDSDASDRDLVARMRVGDERAFEALYRAYKNDLGAYVTSLVGSRESAEEVVQDLFLHLWERRHSLEFPHAFASYLFRAARNRALDQLRHERVTAAYRARLEDAGGRIEEDVAQPSVHAVLEEQDLDRAIELAVGALPPGCREVFLLNRRQRLTYAQVAETLRISPKTVEVQMARALRHLRSALVLFRTGAVAFLTLLRP